MTPFDAWMRTIARRARTLWPSRTRNATADASPYRQGKTKVPRLDRSFTRAWKTLHVFAVFAGMSGCAMSLLDYGAHVDGPGIGFYAGKSGDWTGLFTLLFIAGLVLAFVAQGRAHWTRAWAIGALLWGLSLVAGLPTSLLYGSWEAACRDGAGRACYADVGAHPEDTPRANVLYKRACELGDSNACQRAIERDLITVDAACEKMRAAAARTDDNAVWAQYGQSRCDSDGGFEREVHRP